MRMLACDKIMEWLSSINNIVDGCTDTIYKKLKGDENSTITKILTIATYMINSLLISFIHNPLFSLSMFNIIPIGLLKSFLIEATILSVIQRFSSKEDSIRVLETKIKELETEIRKLKTESREEQSDTKLEALMKEKLLQANKILISIKEDKIEEERKKIEQKEIDRKNQYQFAQDCNKLVEEVNNMFLKLIGGRQQPVG
jgi:hypothetical protein